MTDGRRGRKTEEKLPILGVRLEIVREGVLERICMVMRWKKAGVAGKRLK